jgi:hypothetical protein
LITVIAILGVGFAALGRPSPLWASAIYTVAAAALIVGASGAILGRGARRAYWLGFCLFGGAYFYLTLSTNQLLTEPMLDLLYWHVAPQSQQVTPASPVMPLATVFPDNGTSTDDGSYSISQVSSGPIAPAPPVIYSPSALSNESAWDHWTKPDRYLGDYVLPSEFSARFSSRSFRQIGHSLAALLVATIGGVFVRWRYDKNLNHIGSPELGSAIDEPHPKGNLEG